MSRIRAKISMRNLHQKLTQKYQFYHYWHQHKYHNKAHWGVLAIYIFTIILYTVSGYDAAGNESEKSASAIATTQTGAGQTWQQTLEHNFAHVETFDELQDWTGSGYSDVINQNDMPKKLDGNPSIWQYYSYYNFELRNSHTPNKFSQFKHNFGLTKFV